ncbi:MAG: hypothetical protein DMG16_28060 [Acidobacteria bacterium]|nr:MAG: hypothetical protein DMG16_28060 [Acidobacteriota bacterium]
MHNFRGNSADSAGTLADVAATGHAAVIAATPYITPIIAKARASTMCSAIAPTRYSSRDESQAREPYWTWFGNGYLR